MNNIKYTIALLNGYFGLPFSEAVGPVIESTDGRPLHALEPVKVSVSKGTAINLGDPRLSYGILYFKFDDANGLRIGQKQLLPQEWSIKYEIVGNELKYTYIDDHDEQSDADIQIVSMANSEKTYATAHVRLFDEKSGISLTLNFPVKVFMTKEQQYRKAAQDAAQIFTKHRHWGIIVRKYDPKTKRYVEENANHTNALSTEIKVEEINPQSSVKHLTRLAILFSR